MNRIEMYLDSQGKVRWSYVSRNGRIMADSGQGYVRETDARRGVLVVTGHNLPPTPKFTEVIGGQVRSVWLVAR